MIKNVNIIHIIISITFSLFAFHVFTSLTFTFNNSFCQYRVTGNCNKTKSAADSLFIHNSQAIQIHFYVFMFGDCRLIHCIKLKVLSNVIFVNLMKEYTEEQEQKAHH